MYNLWNRIKSGISDIVKSRTFIAIIMFCVLSAVLLQRVFYLQIVKGQNYTDKYELQIQKTKEVEGTRGNIYDRNGVLLAYNELAYSVTIQDNGDYDKKSEKNKALNQIVTKVINIVESNGDSVINDFGIILDANSEYSFVAESDTQRLRFIADVYGKKTIDELSDKQKSQSAADIMHYLCTDKTYGYGINEKKLDKTMILKLVNVRYAMSLNSYQKYISTTIASDVSDQTVADIMENSDSLQGVNIEEESLRRYTDSKCFSNVIGYTGQISVDEYKELSKKDKSYSLTDVVGKSGIEQVMDKELQGEKGYEKISVDNLGKVVDVIKRKEPTAGNDVYLSIDADLTKAVYDLLEQEIAGIIYSKIENIKEYHSTGSASDIKIPIDDVYFAFINNGMIDTSHFTEDDASDTERTVYSAYTSKESSVLSRMDSLLSGSANTPFGELGEEDQDYITELIKRLKFNGVLDNSAIDTSDGTYVNWKEGKISLNEYLNYAISKSWIDISKFTVEEKYSDSEEIFQSLTAYILDDLKEDYNFSKIVYKYMIRQNMISGTQLCLILYDQGVLEKDEAQIAALSNGSASAYNFVREKIKSLEITPAQLALDPCSGSCVVTNVKTGELLALVSYPGYDNNRLANSVDSEYYSSLSNNLSLPLYNHATQQKTAPGSTFKMVSAVAGLTEGVISIGEHITDKGQFDRFANGPKCWIYPSSHGSINVSEAIRDSCNYYFSEVGYRLSLQGGTYNEEKGLEKIKEYASLFGLDSNTGIEIPESKPEIATEYPVTAAFGQSNHNFTTSELARYVTTVANSGTLYKETLLKKVCDPDGKTIKEYGPTVENQLSEVSGSTWDAVHSGMRMVISTLDAFNGMGVEVAGKTGTAQQVQTRPNHALFVGYAPYSDPEVSIATRIAYGYTSHNAADVSAQILKYYFKLASEEELLDGTAEDVGNSANAVTD